MSSSFDLLDRLFTESATPPGIANVLLSHIRKKTGVFDPYATIKYREYKEAVQAIKVLEKSCGNTLEDLVRLSALGNSTDFFTGGTFNEKSFLFDGAMDKIRDAVYIYENEILMLGDNMGDFIFDIPLVRFLEKEGKTVFYAAKERPVQNDLSMEDVVKLDLVSMHGRILSTGKADVGLTGHDMSGEIERLWKGGGPVIAKGMGNFESISEFDGERQVVYIMKVKCPAVARALNREVGTYIAHPGGE